MFSLKPNLEHLDVQITDASNQPHLSIWIGFNSHLQYPEVQENLKLSVDEQMIPEEPVSSTGTLSSLQHLTKDFSYGDQFINDKPSEANNEKMTADTKAESMVPDSPNVHWPLPTTTTTTSATTTTTLPLPPQPQQGPSNPIIIKRMGELKELIANLVEENQASGSDEIDRKINESVKEVVISSVKHAMRAPLHALQDLLRRTEGNLLNAIPQRQLLQLNTLLGQRLTPGLSLQLQQFLDDLYMDDETTADEQAYSSGEEVGRDHIPTVNLRHIGGNLSAERRPATPEPAWTNRSSDLPVPTNNWLCSEDYISTYPHRELHYLLMTGDIGTFLMVIVNDKENTELTPKGPRPLERPA
ncbi:hypothetical protein Tco_0324807 [Tanacetum coccineum]